MCNNTVIPNSIHTNEMSQYDSKMAVEQVISKLDKSHEVRRSRCSRTSIDKNIKKSEKENMFTKGSLMNLLDSY